MERKAKFRVALTVFILLCPLLLAGPFSSPASAGEFAYSIQGCEAQPFSAGGLAASLVDHRMGIYPPPDCPTPPATVTVFNPGDQAMTWNYITSVTLGATWAVDWFTPTGSSFHGDGTYTQSGNICFAFYWSDGIPNIPGDWWVEFRYNGTLLYTDYFSVSGGPTPWVMVYPKLFGANEGGLAQLRQYRDGVLAATPLGKTYLTRLYQSSNELALLLITNPGLLRQARGVLNRVLPEAAAVNAGGTGYLSSADVDAILSFLDSLAAKGSPELVSLIQNVEAELFNPQAMSAFGFVVE